MCSKPVPDRPGDDLAGRLGSVINDLAADGDGLPEQVLSARLAAAWKLIAAADPELADRAAKYSD
jgi:hypothetical protein